MLISGDIILRQFTYQRSVHGRRRVCRHALMGVSLLALVGCQTTGVDGGQTRSGVVMSIDKPLEYNKSVLGMPAEDSAIQTLVRDSIDFLKQGNAKEASRLINLALKLDVTNPDLQFLNGLTYHLMGVLGDASKFELAEQGYKQSLKFDPGNLPSRYQLGLLYMDQRRYPLAQENFAAVALHHNDDPAVLYSLASASYYSRDPRTAAAALKRLMEISPESRENPEILKATALALSAMDDRSSAQEFITAYRDVIKDVNRARDLDRRVEGWQSFYESEGKYIQAQFSGEPFVEPESDGEISPFDSNPFGQTTEPSDPFSNVQDPFGGQNIDDTPTEFVDSGMVVVDVVLIGTQEDIRDSRGINLLNGLQLQFGDPLTGAAGLGYGSTKTKDYLGTGLEESTQTITRQIGIPAVTYSLNIANSADANNQVLAKPSLVAQAGETSEFFSGTEILAAAVSGGSGDSVSVQKEVGVKLAVTPEILPNDMIRLHVVAERTFLTDPSNSVVFEFRLDTTKTNVNSTVTMKFGETLILGGLSERETSKSADGVPGLKDIPGLNYFFSQRVEREFERSILILMTPRRPVYTRQSGSDRAAVNGEMSELEQELAKLERRHGDWYTPRPTFDVLREQLEGKAFFEEFRAGDVQIDAWQSNPESQQMIASVRDRLLEN